MVKTFIGEEWREIKIEKGALQKRYAISNFGRVASFFDKLEDGMVLKNRQHGGYLSISVAPFGRKTSWLVHRLVAEYFLPIPDKDQVFVLHLDFNKKNNKVDNLKWATQEESTKHQQNSPYVKQYKAKKIEYVNFDSYTLNETKVRMIKRIINNPNRKTRLKVIAKQFGISEMQLYRIKKGIHWGHVQ